MDNTLVAEQPVITTAKTQVVTTVNVALTLDQLLEAVRQLDEQGRSQVAEALKDAELEARWAAFNARYPTCDSIDEAGEEELGELINEEIRAHRREQAEQRHATRRH